MNYLDIGYKINTIQPERGPKDIGIAQEPATKASTMTNGKIFGKSARTFPHNDDSSQLLPIFASQGLHLLDVAFRFLALCIALLLEIQKWLAPKTPTSTIGLANLSLVIVCISMQ
jgi:hypothetical protein